MEVTFLLERNSPSSLKTIFAQTFTLLEERGVRVQAFSPAVCQAPMSTALSPMTTWPTPTRSSRVSLLAKTFSAFAIPLLLTETCGPVNLLDLTGDCSRWTHDA